MYDLSKLTTKQKIIWNFIKQEKEITEDLIPSSIPRWKVFNAIANKITYEGKPIGFIRVDLNIISIHDMYFKTYNKKGEEVQKLSDIFNLTYKKPCIVVFTNFICNAPAYKEKMLSFIQEKRINNAYFPENTFLLID